MAVVSVIWSAAPDVWAGGYATSRFGGEHGHAATDHPTAVFFNPAGLAFGVGTRIYVEGLFVHRQASYERPVGAIDNFGTGTPDNDPLAEDANSGLATLSNFLASPFLGVATDLGVDGLGLSLAAYAPFGGQASWDTREEFADNATYPGAFDGPQRWHNIEGTHRVLFGSLGLAYRLPSPRIGIGISVNAVQQTLETIRARNADGSDDLVSVSGITEGRTLLSGSQLSYSIGAGVMWQTTDQLRVGVSYQSMPGFGESHLDGELTSRFGAGGAGTVDTRFLLTLPDSVRAGLVYRLAPDTELRVSGDYTRWSTFERHCVLVMSEANPDPTECDVNPDGSAITEGVLLVIPRDWNDTFGVRVGGSYWLSPGFETFAGIGYDSSAVPDETLDPSLMDMDKIVSTLGVRYGLGDKVRLTGSFTNVYYFSRDVTPRPAAAENLASPSRNPDSAGVYKQLINFITVGAQYTF